MNRSFGSLASGIVLAGLFLVPGNVKAQNRAPDNAAVNKRDRDKSTPTADQAQNNLSDREMMKRIRKDVVNDKTLSTYGHNVKIIADHGKVTLKGPVHSEDEKRTIEEHARKYASAGNVANELTVKGDQK
jgi:hyperosmotically inducible periplasmic protein